MQPIVKCSKTMGWRYFRLHSHSEADATLCSMLAFYCSGNRKPMDRPFRNSALYRSKWDEYRGTDTYGDITNKNAISKSKTFYTSIQKLSAYDDFDDKIHVEQS